jgi:hypothetical protein
MSYTNADGLRVVTDTDQGVVKVQGTSPGAMHQTLVIDIPAFTAIKTTFGAVDIDLMNPVIPANSLIMSATLVMTTIATSGGAATLDIGTYNAAGTAVAATGIDAAIALAAIDAVGETVRCDGTMLTTAGWTGAADVYVGLKWNTAAYTAGAGKLLIEYVKL